MTTQNDNEATPAVPLLRRMTPARPRRLVALHWFTVLCLVLLAILILVREEVEGRSLRFWLLEGHREFGLLVLALFFARVALRARNGKWPNDAGASPLLRAAALLTHAALYALLLAQPLLGWALSNALGQPVRLLGVPLPALVGADDALADDLTDWHQDAAWLLLALVLLHAGAALWHHFVLRDGVLRAMLPRRRR